MAFTPRLWKDRVSEFPLRRRQTDVDTGEIKTVDIERDEGLVREPGYLWSAENMNHMEDRIVAMDASQTKALTDEITGVKSTATANYNTLNTRITTEKAALNSTITTNYNTLNTAITAATTNAKAKPTTVTVTASGWSTVTDSGQSVYRKTTTVTGNTNDIPILGLPPGQIKQLTSSPSLVNDGGTIYIYSAQIPNISLTVTVTLVQTR